MEQFLQVVRPSILSYDQYSFLKSTDRPGFFENLDRIRREAARHRVPFWQIVLLVDHRGVYRPAVGGRKAMGGDADARLWWQGPDVLHLLGAGTEPRVGRGRHQLRRRADRQVELQGC